MATARPAPPPRGDFVEIAQGGARRRLHIVRAGPASGEPLVLLEAGSFGFSADWAVVQAGLARFGRRSLAYDRAGLGLSQPGPAPRDGLAIVSDLERMLEAAGETGPLILAGHSMAGLHLHLFAGRNPGRIAGLVLVDAVTPGVAAHPTVARGAAHYVSLAKAVAWGASSGLLDLASRWGDRIGLPDDAAAHKRWAFANPGHRRAAADEIIQWERAVAQAAAAGPLDPRWPVVVVTAGPAPMYFKPRAIQADPAARARLGYIQNVPKANHASLMGRRHAQTVVKAIEFVHKAAASLEPATSP
jgi:pimeloyl-ACP methyl ester carboxylesterase